AAVARGRAADRAAAQLRRAVDALPRNAAAAGPGLPAVRAAAAVPRIHRLRGVLQRRLTCPPRRPRERLQPRAFPANHRRQECSRLKPLPRDHQGVTTGLATCIRLRADPQDALVMSRSRTIVAKLLPGCVLGFALLLPGAAMAADACPL